MDIQFFHGLAMYWTRSCIFGKYLSLCLTNSIVSVTLMHKTHGISYLDATQLSPFWWSSHLVCMQMFFFQNFWDKQCPSSITQNCSIFYATNAVRNKSCASFTSILIKKVFSQKFELSILRFGMFWTQFYWFFWKQIVFTKQINVCKKLSIIFSGPKNITRPFVRRN